MNAYATDRRFAKDNMIPQVNVRAATRTPSPTPSENEALSGPVQLFNFRSLFKKGHPCEYFYGEHIFTPHTDENSFARVCLCYRRRTSRHRYSLCGFQQTNRACNSACRQHDTQVSIKWSSPRRARHPARVSLCLRFLT